jgi:hypothetical protein
MAVAAPSSLCIRVLDGALGDPYSSARRFEIDEGEKKVMFYRHEEGLPAAPHPTPDYHIPAENTEVRCNKPGHRWMKLPTRWPHKSAPEGRHTWDHEAKGRMTHWPHKTGTHAHAGHCLGQCGRAKKCSIFINNYFNSYFKDCLQSCDSWRE